jgi:hypothetical protein
LIIIELTQDTRLPGGTKVLMLAGSRLSFERIGAADYYLRRGVAKRVNSNRKRKPNSDGVVPRSRKRTGKSAADTGSSQGSSQPVAE